MTTNARISYQVLPEDESNTPLEQAKQQVLDWYKKLDAKQDPSVIFPINQLLQGYLYPHALPILPKKEHYQLLNYIRLLNRLSLIDDSKDMLNHSTDPGQLITFFTGSQEALYNKLNDDCAAELNKFTSEDDKEFAQKIIAYQPRLKHGNVRDEDGCLRAYIAEIKPNFPTVTNRKIIEMKALRKKILKQKSALDANLKRLKRDINHVLADMEQNNNQDKQLIRNIEKIPGLRAYKSPLSEEEFKLHPKYQAKTIDNGSLEAKRSTYDSKQLHTSVASGVAFYVGVGEGAVPGVFMYDFIKKFAGIYAIPISLLVAASGFVFNKFLVEDDTKDVLNKLRLSNSLNNMSCTQSDYQLEWVEDSDSTTAAGPEFGKIYVWIGEDSNLQYKLLNQEKLAVNGSLRSTANDKYNGDNFGKLKQGDKDFDAKLFANFKKDLFAELIEKKYVPGDAVQQVKKDFAISLGGMSLTTGLVYGALSAIKLYSGVLAPLIGAASITGLPGVALGVGTALPPVFLTALGFFSMYFFVIAELIEKERWIGIKNYFYDKFFDVAWSELSISEKFAQLASWIFEVIKILLVVSVAVVVCTVSFKMFRDQVIEVASNILSEDNDLLFATLITMISSFICYVFNVKKLSDMTLKHTLADLLVGLLLLVPRLIMLVSAAINTTLRLALTLVALTPFAMFSLLRMLMVSLPLNSCMALMEGVKLLAYVLNPIYLAKAAINLVTLAVSLLVLTLAATWFFATKCAVLPFYLCLMVLSALTFNKVKAPRLWAGIAKVSKQLELPGLGLVFIQQTLTGWVASFNKQVDNSALARPSKLVAAAADKVENKLIAAKNKVALSSANTQACSKTFALALTVFQKNNEFSPFALLARCLDSKIRQASDYLHKKQSSPDAQDNAASSEPTASDRVGLFAESVQKGLLPAVAPNSIGQSIGSAFEPNNILSKMPHVLLWRILSALCSFQISAVPNQVAAEKAVENLCATGLKAKADNEPRFPAAGLVMA